MPITVYGFSGSPPCRTVYIVAEALGLKLEIKKIDIVKGDHLKPEYLKINPLHSMPTLDDNGIIVVDSHAISAYLVAKYGKDDSLYPKDIVKKALVDAKLHFDTGYVFKMLRKVFKAFWSEGQKGSLTSKQIEEIENIYAFLNTFLTDNKWLIGDSFTIADISLFTSMTSLEAILPADSGKFPHIRRWLNDAKKLPFSKVNEEGLEQLQKSWLAMISKK